MTMCSFWVLISNFLSLMYLEYRGFFLLIWIIEELCENFGVSCVQMHISVQMLVVLVMRS
ncbi:hypothetical protein Hanom_Chr10g00966081 [Helianthus anomalus]